jgi:hypothetical protein
MNNVSQFMLETKRALSTHDDSHADNYVNTDKFNASGKLEDIWNEAHSALVQKYSLPAFHLWEDGFQEGDADNDGIIEAANKINEIEGPGTVSASVDDGDIDTDIFEFLDGKLIEILRPKTNQLIAEYNKFCKKALAS